MAIGIGREGYTCHDRCALLHTASWRSTWPPQTVPPPIEAFDGAETRGLFDPADQEPYRYVIFSYKATLCRARD